MSKENKFLIGVAQLTLFPEDSHVNRSHVLEKEKRKPTSEICGQRCIELFQRSNQLGFLLKMFVESSNHISTQFSPIWKRLDTPAFRSLFQLVPLEPHIKGNVYGLWRTPKASDGDHGGPNARDKSGRLHLSAQAARWPTPTVFGNHNRKGLSKKSGDGLATAVKMWPTPQSHDSQKGYLNRVERFGTKHGGRNLNDEVLMFPTPSATDYKGAGKTGKLRDRLDYAAERGATKKKVFATTQARDYRTGQKTRWNNPNRSRNLNDQIGGQLNPTWVEWLMGLPTGWTDLKCLETAKSFKLLNGLANK